MLDHQKLLARDPSTTKLFLMVARRWVNKFFRKPSQLDGVTQSAMIEMLDKLRDGNVPEPDRVYCWVLTCANNAVRRELTRVRNNKVVSYESQLHCPHTVGSGARARAYDELQRVNALLKACDAGARRILEARACGHSYKEISEAFAIGPGAARASVSRLRKQLIAQLRVQDGREGLRQGLLRSALTRHHVAASYRSSSSTS